MSSACSAALSTWLSGSSSTITSDVSFDRPDCALSRMRRVMLTPLNLASVGVTYVVITRSRLLVCLPLPLAGRVVAVTVEQPSASNALQAYGLGYCGV